MFHQAVPVLLPRTLFAGIGDLPLEVNRPCPLDILQGSTDEAWHWLHQRGKAQCFI